MEIYNTLTNKKETFKPITPGKISMYVCGPTVYNYIHIGNARSIVAFDVVRRYFEYKGFDVTYVSNFTDVDDKIIKAAREEGLSTGALADKYIAAYFDDTKALNVEPSDIYPRVSEMIPEIIQFIADIIANGYAYESEGDVYYRTRKFKAYGELSGISIDSLEEGASQRTDAEMRKLKEDVTDFALWKKAKPGEVSWDSPWGKGRPGWHIECSVMSTHYLGDTFDIHAGGQDLQFPHHENEIAQSEAKTGKKFVNYWMHNGFVNIDNEKMSKSLGNFILVHDLIKAVDPQVIRFFMATAHYRQPINYTEESLHDAAANLSKLQNAYRNITYRKAEAQASLADDAHWLTRMAELEDEFVLKMDDDFNAQNGITVVYEMAREMNLYSQQAEISAPVIADMTERFSRLLDVFGIKLQLDDEMLDVKVEEMIAEREQARAEKDFSKADAIRDRLQADGIILEDTPQGIRWRRD